jgi:hypothetical protein
MIRTRVSMELGPLDRPGTAIAATLYVTRPRCAGRWRLQQLRWHLWDVDAPMHEVGPRGIGSVQLGPALCGRDGEVGYVYPPGVAELLIVESSGRRDHGGCDRCLAVYRDRMRDGRQRHPPASRAEIVA